LTLTCILLVIYILHILLVVITESELVNKLACNVNIVL